MDPQMLRFGGGADSSLLHPAVLVAFLLASVLVLTLPRRWVTVPFLYLSFLAPQGQQLYLGGVHWYITRLIVLVGLIRVLISSNDDGQRIAGGWNRLDTVVLGYIFVEAVATTLLFREVGAAISQAALLVDCIGGYIFLRAFISNKQDVERVIRCMAVLCIIFCGAMLYEQHTMTNLFGFLGGIRPAPELREGKVRAQAAFQHALTAGAFAGTSLPLFALLWKNTGSKVLSVLAAAAATAMVFYTQTSSSLITLAAGIFAICCWPLRKNMRVVRISIATGLLVLNMVMKAPVWFLLAHIDLTGSSSSYHRAALIDVFVRNFSDWWLIGTNNNSSWGWDMWDVQNQFVSVGQGGGLLALVLFIMVFVRAFSAIGKERAESENTPLEWGAWLLGVTLFTHMVSYFGVNYFDQSRLIWYLLLAFVPAYGLSIAAEATAKAAPVPITAPVSAELRPAYARRGWGDRARELFTHSHKV